MLQVNENNQPQKEYSLNPLQSVGTEGVLLHQSVYEMNTIDPEFALLLSSTHLKLDEVREIDEFNERDYMYTKVTVYVKKENLNLFLSRATELKNVMESVAPYVEGIEYTNIYLQFKIDPWSIHVDWKSNFKSQVESEQLQINNQGNNCNNYAPLKYNGHNYRSKTEIRIAEELINRGVVFYPLCSVYQPGVSVHKESDFLIQDYNNKWGILEINGPSHDYTAQQDHDKFKELKKRGLNALEYYSAERCYNHPADVVTEFLQILNA